MKTDLVSIVVPIYNTSQYLEKCLNSIKVQNYSNIEVLLVDDGSTDLSGEIVHEFSLKDKRFQVIHLENGGVSRARNKGLNLARGKYVTFVDSDDYILENHIENLVKNFKDGVILTICNYLLDENGITRKGIKNKWGGTCNKDELLKQLVNTYGGFSWNKMFDLQFIKENKIKFDESFKMCEDLEFVLKYILRSNGKIFYSNLATYGYVQREDSVTHICDIEVIKTYFQALSKCNEMIEDASFESVVSWKKELVLAFYGTKERFIANHVDTVGLEDIYNQIILPIWDKKVFDSCSIKEKLKLYMQSKHMKLFIQLHQ